MGDTRIICGDCLEVLPALADSSVQLIATDPPYYRVKNEPWDRQWDTAEGYLEWFGQLCEQWYRILAPNGSLSVFASPKMAARVEVKLGEWFNVLNQIVWQKELDRGKHAVSCKEALRGFFPNTERIIFCEHRGADGYARGEAGYGAKCDELRGFVFEPLRAYLAGERDRAGWTTSGVDTEWQAMRSSKGCMAGHWFGVSQWELPTPENHAWLQTLFNRGNGTEYLRREYEDLRREYEDLRREYEDLRRPFSVTADVPYTDVWDFATVQAYPGKHPCEKPLDMMEHIVSSSSREGDTVLDCFMGSGNTGKAAHNLGREFIGIDASAHWCEVAEKRLSAPVQLRMPL